MKRGTVLKKIPLGNNKFAITANVLLSLTMNGVELASETKTFTCDYKRESIFYMKKKKSVQYANFKNDKITPEHVEAAFPEYGKVLDVKFYTTQTERDGNTYDVVSKLVVELENNTVRTKKIDSLIELLT